MSLAHERNGTIKSRSTNRYLKRIKRCNRTPRQPGENLAFPTNRLFKAVLDYGEGHYETLPLDPQGKQFANEAKDKQRHWPVRQNLLSTYGAYRN